MAGLVVLALGSVLMAGPAGADPSGAPNSLTGTADCGSAGTFTFVANSANGHGSGLDNNGNQAPWTPAHLNPGNGVFHPTAFNLSFSFTPTGGTTQTDTEVATRSGGRAGNLTCTISASSTFPE